MEHSMRTMVGAIWGAGDGGGGDGGCGRGGGGGVGRHVEHSEQMESCSIGDVAVGCCATGMRHTFDIFLVEGGRLDSQPNVSPKVGVALGYLGGDLVICRRHLGGECVHVLSLVRDELEVEPLGVGVPLHE